ncbi:MAG: hypothetical protein KAU20_05715 [Nanoarchaeota archaeon]|nr:hypothetical protein [Nanoarchaeota archaeon]
MKYKEPVGNEECEFKLIPINQLKTSPFQREISKALVKNLSQSMIRGFIGVITVYQESEDSYVVLDGQHRLESVKPMLPPEAELPTIVVPKKYMFQPLIYNIEKADNTKDLCLKLFKEYEWFVQNQAEAKESDVFQVVTMGRPHLLSLAYSFGVCGLISPSLVDMITKKLDSFLTTPVFEAREVRIKRGQLLKELEEKADAICAGYDVKDFNLKKSVISRTSTKLWGRVRSLDMSFEEGISMLMNELDESDFSWLERT